MRVWPMILMTAALVGCPGPTGPASTDTSCDALPSLEERVEFLQRYVTFRRGYVDLGFHIVCHNNNGGMVPGPSDWDIRLVATVPPSELDDRVPAGEASLPTAETQWLTGVPGAESAAGIVEWYTSTGRVVGIDRKRSVVAYRLWAN